MRGDEHVVPNSHAIESSLADNALKVDLGYGKALGWQPDAPAELPLS
jgi:hypothetical protein